MFRKKKREGRRWLSIAMGVTCGEPGPRGPARPCSPPEQGWGGRTAPAPVFVTRVSKLVTLRDKLRALKTSACAVSGTSMWFAEFPASLVTWAFFPPVGCSVPTPGLPSLPLPAFRPTLLRNVPKSPLFHGCHKRFPSLSKGCLSPPSPNALVTGLRDGTPWVPLLLLSLPLFHVPEPPSSPPALTRGSGLLLSCLPGTSAVLTVTCTRGQGPHFSLVCSSGL